MTVTLQYQEQVYQPVPRFMTWLEIEDELGSLPALYQRLVNGRWRLSELVVAAHILLSAAGCECDYEQLGDDILRRGVEQTRRDIAQLLSPLMQTTD